MSEPGDTENCVLKCEKFGCVTFCIDFRRTLSKTDLVLYSGFRRNSLYQMTMINIVNFSGISVVNITVRKGRFLWDLYS